MLESDDPRKGKDSKEEVTEEPKAEKEWPSPEDSSIPGWTYYNIASLMAAMGHMFPDQPMLIHIEIDSGSELEDEQEDEEHEASLEEIPAEIQEDKKEEDRTINEVIHMIEGDNLEKRISMPYNMAMFNIARHMEYSLCMDQTKRDAYCKRVEKALSKSVEKKVRPLQKKRGLYCR